MAYWLHAAMEITCCALGDRHFGEKPLRELEMESTNLDEHVEFLHNRSA